MIHTKNTIRKINYVVKDSSNQRNSLISIIFIDEDQLQNTMYKGKYKENLSYITTEQYHNQKT